MSTYSLSFSDISTGSEGIIELKSQDILSFSDSSTGTETLSITDSGNQFSDSSVGSEQLCITVIRKLTFLDSSTGFEVIGPIFDWDNPRNEAPTPSLSGDFGPLPNTYPETFSERSVGTETLRFGLNGTWLVPGRCE